MRPPSKPTSPDKGLTSCAIAKVVNAHYPAFRACGRKPDGTWIRGTVTITWRMKPSGDVSDASVAGSSISGAEAAECIRSGIADLKFHTADMPTGASWTFLFRKPR